MVLLQKVMKIDITSKKFVDNCTNIELQELIAIAKEKLSRGGVKTQEPITGKSLKKRNWSEQENALLRELYPIMRGADVAKKLNRSYKSVMLYASKLGLHKKTGPQRQLPPKPVPREKNAERKTDCIGLETGQYMPKKEKEDSYDTELW
jgi:hypothetical protein